MLIMHCDRCVSAWLVVIAHWLSSSADCYAVWLPCVVVINGSQLEACNVRGLGVVEVIQSIASS